MTSGAGGDRGAAAPGKTTLVQSASMGVAPVVQRKPVDDSTAQPLAGPDPMAVQSEGKADAAVDSAAAPPEEDFKPTTGTKKTTVKGTFGDYEVEHGLTKLHDKTRNPPWGEYTLKITMKPNAKTGTSTIAFVQTVRRLTTGGGWATKATDSGMNAERAKRTDSKTGFRVDRYDATATKTPFYGMQKGGDGKLTETSNTHQGKHGGDDPWMKDVPGTLDPDKIQFTATATDIADGIQFDAIGWGFEYDSAKKVYSEETPSLVMAGSERMAGRDRAISKWNTDVATTGSGIDKVPTKSDPAAVATTLQTALSAATVDKTAVRTTLLAVTDADVRARVAACYKLETGRELKADLEAKLSVDELKGLDAWH